MQTDPPAAAEPLEGHAGRLLDARAILGEGARWDPRTERLAWVDILGRAVHRFDPLTGQDEVFPMPAEPGCALPTDDGRLAVALPDGIHLLDTSDGSLEPWAPIPHDPARFLVNDGYTDAEGRIWIGSVARDAEPGAAALYRVEPGGRTTLMVRDITCSNGVGWSLDGRTMLYVDSTTRRIDAFAFEPDTGTLGPRRTFATLPPGPELPDGLTVDEGGGVWVAIWDGGMAIRFRPDGSIERRVRIGTPRATSCALGGPGLRTLFVTSASVGLPEADAASTHAGALWSLTVSVPGRVSVPVRLRA
jgi:sugar lactone lactonase YvrE